MKKTIPSEQKTSEQTSVLLRALPSMAAVLDALCLPLRDDPDTTALCASLLADVPRPLLRDGINDFLDRCRASIRQGRIKNPAELSLAVLLPQTIRHTAKICAPHFRRVLNATGVVLHTNLGRSLLAEKAAEAVCEAARHYANLEFDLETGERGSRYSHVEELICRLTGADAALVVNNNAAAVLLMLDTLCRDREVVISRGELVEIGGGFRIPTVMEKSGCILREVGTTNRTHLEDYVSAICERTAALLKVHTSNYRIVGFTKAVPRRDIAALAREKGLPLLEDLGSGILADPGMPHLSDEPTVGKVLKDGVDVVTFSGDKVLGGPQAGIIAGKAEYIDRIKKNPLNRALRIDKLTLAALESTLRLHLDPELARRHIPTLHMLCMDEQQLQGKADALAAVLKASLPEGGENIGITVGRGDSRAGGGTFPESDLPTRLVCVTSADFTPNALQKALLHVDPPVLARVENDALCFDPRTLRNEEFSLVAAALRSVLA
ncbi:MAG: L-seryl-tRNA(Sec) selenium transferase [Desulfovibrionaceae bacterium]|nr:L-seryl-tRNA(Sec) selenium transferase [Desulfovibrionaceae bacterium]